MRVPVLVLTLPLLLTVCRDVSRSGTQAQGSASRTSVDHPASGDSTLTSQPDSAGLKRYRIVEHHLIVVDVHGSPIFLRETSDQHCCLGGERNTWGTVGLDRFADSIAKRRIWGIVLKADTGQVWGSFYRAVLRGCCDSEDVLTFVSVTTGQVIFVSSRPFDASSDLPSVTESRTATTRYFAFHDRYTEHDPPEAMTDSAVVGVLQYGPSDGPVTRITVQRTNGSPVDFRLESLNVSLRGVEQDGSQVSLPNPLRTSDAAALSGFEINIHLTNSHSDEPEDVRIRIPVQADQLRLDRAVIPPGFTLSPSSAKVAPPAPPA